MKKRDGFTLPEVLVAGSVLMMVLGLLGAMVLQSMRATARVGASEETVRALSVGLEAVRRDVRRLVLLDPKQDLAIAPDGRALGLRAPHARGDDFWSSQQDVIVYSLGGAGDAHTLLRADGGAPRAIGGCQLADIEFRLVPAHRGSRCSGYLSVTLLGPVAPKGCPRLTVSALLPLVRIPTPLPYKV